MAGEWLKVEACTPEKAEVMAITAHMGWDDADLTVGKLFRIWRWFDQQTTNGNAPSVTPALLDRIVCVSGFCNAMKAVGWLCITDAGISLPNFERHNGNTAKNRALTAKRVANHKANAQGNAQGNGESVSEALAREEKKREEEEKNKKDSEAKASGGKPPKLTDPNEIIFGYGLALLVNAGTPDKQARSFLGGLRKHHGDEALINRLRECAMAQPLQPLEWLAAALPPQSSSAANGGIKLNAQEALEAANRAVGERFLAKRGIHAPA